VTKAHLNGTGQQQKSTKLVFYDSGGKARILGGGGQYWKKNSA